MGLSGRVGAGVLDELEQMVAQQQIAQRMKLQEEGEAFDRQMRQMQFEAQQQERNEDVGYRQRQEARQTAADRTAGEKSASEATARSNMSELLNDPTQLAAFSMASGVDVPSTVRDMTKPPPPPKLRSVTVRGSRGEPINRMVPETEEVEEYREPRQGPAPEKPTYIQVVGPDGTMQVLTPDEIRSRGGVPTAKGTQADPSKAQDVLQRIVESGTKLRDSSGRESLTGSRVGNPAYGMGFMEKPVAGTEAANAQTYFDTLRSVMTLENLGLLKGVLSDRDIQMLQSASSSLNTAMQDDAFKTELDGIIAKAQAALAPKVPNNPAAAPGGGTPALVFDPATGRLIPVGQ